MGFWSSLGSAAAIINPSMALGAITGFGDSIFGAIGANADRQAASDLNAANIRSSQDINASSQAFAREQMAMERDFAQNGISWRIADAARSGISPLAALGASAPSYSPVHATFTAPDRVPVSRGDSFRAFQGMSQNVSRALLATKSPAERTSEMLDLAFKAKQNELLDIDIANSKRHLATSASPGIPLAYRTVMNRDGTTSVIPTEDFGRSAHAESFGSLLWSLHNGLVPEIYRRGGDRFLEGVGKFFRPDVRGRRMVEEGFRVK